MASKHVCSRKEVGHRKERVHRWGVVKLMLTRLLIMCQGSLQ